MDLTTLAGTRVMEVRNVVVVMESKDIVKREKEAVVKTVNVRAP